MAATRTNVGVKRGGRDDDDDEAETKRPRRMDAASTSAGGGGGGGGGADVANDFVRRNVTMADKNMNKMKEECYRAIHGTYDVTAKKFEWSKIVVRTLDPYYKERRFSNSKLFSFMARSIVHKIIESSAWSSKKIAAFRYK